MNAGRGIGAAALDAASGAVAECWSVPTALAAARARASAHLAPDGYRLGDLLWPGERARRLLAAHMMVLNRQGERRL
jgi:hypothetical protein